MPYPNSFIQELKARNPIEDVISRHVELKRAGSNLIGLCPFHSERTPSFTVFSDNFHCFGCSAGGDVITFVMRMENLDYPDAIQSLADRCGMTVPENTFVRVKLENTLTREKAFEMNKHAARHFVDNLLAPDARQAREYLDKRQLPESVRRRFGIGYAKNSFNDLTSFLMNKGFTVEEIKENFLCGISPKNGKPFDMFRNRIIIPIIDTVGNVIAFGGRVLDDSKPKYLNSSDTVVFKKSRNLFALNFAKNTILGDDTGSSGYAKPGEMVICEGYMDVIAMHQAGFSNAVATLGTAITQEHARLISRYAKTVFLAYDSDSAGQTATERAIQLLYEVGVDAKVLKITGAKDPDEYIKKYGAASFAKLLSASEGHIDYRLNKILSKYNLTVLDEKLKAIQEACKMLAGFYSELKRDIYATRLSELTDTKRDIILSEIKRNMRIDHKKAYAKINDELINKTYKYDDRVNLQAAAYRNEVMVEQRILGIIMLFPEMLENVKQLTEDLFVTDFNKELFLRLKELYSQGALELSALNEFYNPQEFSYILQMKAARQMLNSNGIETLKEQIELLKSIQNKAKVNYDEDFENIMKKIKDEKLKGK